MFTFILPNLGAISLSTLNSDFTVTSFFLNISSQLRLHQNQILSPVVRVAKLGLDWCLVPKVAENKYKYKHIDKRHRQKQAS